MVKGLKLNKIDNDTFDLAFIAAQDVINGVSTGLSMDGIKQKPPALTEDGDGGPDGNEEMIVKTRSSLDVNSSPISRAGSFRLRNRSKRRSKQRHAEQQRKHQAELKQAVSQ